MATVSTQRRPSDWLPAEDRTDWSRAQHLAAAGPDVWGAYLNALNEQELRHLPYNWEFWARPKQLPPPGDWQYWLLLAGRGFGKTRAIAEFANYKARTMPNGRGAIVATTAADVRDVIVEGESGILASAPPEFKPVWNPSTRRLTWPNGAVATTFSAEKPDSLRGPQFHWGIADELAAWRYPAAWDMLQFGMRLGHNPQIAIATTPRPVRLVRELLNDPNCRVVRGSTYENRSALASAFFAKIISKYEGTRLGRQELLAEVLDDVPGALWNGERLELTRIVPDSAGKMRLPEMYRIVVAVDPAATTGTTGIVVAGIGRYRAGAEEHGFVLDDVTLEAGASPAQWGDAVVAAYHKWGADLIVAESNHGGNMVASTIKAAASSAGTGNIPVKLIRASRGKYTRAEPVALLFERFRAHLVGYFGSLESELCQWLPGEEESPNRLDAMVWALTELMLEEGPKRAGVLF